MSLLLASFALAGGCSFDSAVGTDQSDAQSNACDPGGSGNCDDAGNSNDVDPKPEDTSGDTQIPDFDSGSDDAGCPSGDCSCDYDGTSEGVCSMGTLENGACTAPDSWLEEEGGGSGCGDNLDNDCDGDTDEECGCEPGTMEPCYTGPNGTKNTGACSPGQRECKSDGTWSTCKGETTPSNEQCGNGVDEDCNGTADDGKGCSCSFKSGNGVCSSATYDDSGNCTAPKDYEMTESSCDDGLDNDCDGNTDAADPACPGLAAGTPCSSHAACRSGFCPNTGSQNRCAYRIFVTSKSFSADFGSVSGADQKCNDVASAAGLKGNWKAVISEKNDAARDRISFDAPLLNTNRDLVAGDEQRLWNDNRSLVSPVDYDESRNQIDVSVWTGSDLDGTWDGSNTGDAGNDCNGWTTTMGNRSAEVGGSDRGFWWLQGDGSVGDGTNNRPCDQTAHLYCIDGQ